MLLLLLLATAEPTDGVLLAEGGLGAGGLVLVENDQRALLPAAGPTLRGRVQLGALEVGALFQSLLAPGDLAPSLEMLTLAGGARVDVADSFSFSVSLGPTVALAHFGCTAAPAVGASAYAEARLHFTETWSAAASVGGGALGFPLFGPGLVVAPAWLALTLQGALPV